MYFFFVVSVLLIELKPPSTYDCKAYILRFGSWHNSFSLSKFEILEPEPIKLIADKLFVELFHWAECLPILRFQ